MKRFTTLLLSAILSLAAAADERDEYFTHNRFAISGALTSSDCWQLEMSYHYMFWQWAGIGGGLGVWKNYFVDGHASGRDWMLSDDDARPSNLYLRPSVVLKSPSICIKDAYLSLYAEPGIMLQIPYQSVGIDYTTDGHKTKYTTVSTSKGQWCALDVRLGINVDVGPCGFSAGYVMSNLDIYSQYRHLSYRGESFRRFYPSKPFMKGAYLTLSYNF